MWVTPKTNWTKDEYFNAVDFNRIKNNLEHLRELSIKVYKDFSIKLLGKDRSYSDYFYADEINILEDNFEKINNNTIKMSYGNKMVYKDNGNTMTFTELNRIESAILDIYDKLINQIDGRRCFTWSFGEEGGL